LTPRQLASGRNVFEELGEGFCLIDLGSPAAMVRDFEKAAEDLRIPLKVISDPSAESRDFYKAGLVLVRPDQFVAWTSAAESVDASAVLKRAVGAGP
jgi:hypothetical protein